MGRTISIGAQSFEFIRKNDCFFVDKTGFIKGLYREHRYVRNGKGMDE
ncbi:MAG: AAA family ATPase [Lachnospiraceae bacterium]|nr:AAA family ATPase [Lachnospiraceae bacterium]